MTTPLLRLTRVARTYRNGDVLVEALKPVDLEVDAGTCVAVTADAYRCDCAVGWAGDACESERLLYR